MKCKITLRFPHQHSTATVSNTSFYLHTIIIYNVHAYLACISQNTPQLLSYSQRQFMVAHHNAGVACTRSVHIHCMYTVSHIHVYTHMSVWKQEVSVGCLPQLLSLLRQDLSLSWSSWLWLEWLVNSPRNPPVSAALSLGD